MTTTSVSIRAQAKLNLWLRVLAREESGYHSIETLFHRIELADDLVVTIAPPGERSITCSEDVGAAHDNLAYRAAQLYCDATEWNVGFHVRIVKRIPARGGLGGGSADAAATLLALNTMSPHEQDQAALIELGSRLGADVPFLLSGAARALAWGHGDRMLALPALPQKHVALVVPSFGISTAEAYGSFVLRDRAQAVQLSDDDLSDWSGIAPHARNDLSQSAAVTRLPAIGEAIGALRAAGAVVAEMTGSGSVLFGIFDKAPDAEALGRATGCRVLLTRTALNVEGVVRLD